MFIDRPSSGLCDASPMSGLRYRGEDSLHQGHMLSTGPITDGINPDRQAQPVAVNFPTVKLLLTPSLSYCLEGNDHAQSTLKGGGIHINHLEFICMGGLPVLSHLFIQYHFYQCGLLGIYFIVLFITQYYLTLTLPCFGPTPE